MDNVLTHYESIKQLQQGIMCKPRFASLHTSNCCNQNCKGCAYANIINGQVLDFDNQRKILIDLMDLGVRGFEFAGGGEPLLIPQIVDLWKLLIDNQRKFGVLTNGTLLTDEMINFIVRHGTYIRISLEATDEDTYSKYKRVPKDIWNKVLTNVEKLVAYRDEFNSSCEVSIKFSIGKSLKGEKFIQNGVLLGNRLKVNNVQFKALRHEPEELSLDAKHEQEIFLNHYCQDKKFRWWVIPWDYEDIPQCWLNPLHVVVDYNGDVHLCCYYYYRDNYKLGNMLQTPIKELWYSDKHFELIKNIKREECAKVDCKFFRHHKIVDEAFKNGAIEFL